jgi:hypothetical protein
MDEKMILRIHPDLARKYLEANWYEDRRWKKAIQVLDEIGKKCNANGGSLENWKVWVYAKFEKPNWVLVFINDLHKRHPKLAENLVFSANAEFLEGIYMFLVKDEAGRLTVTDWIRI